MEGRPLGALKAWEKGGSLSPFRTVPFKSNAVRQPLRVRAVATSRVRERLARQERKQQLQGQQPPSGKQDRIYFNVTGYPFPLGPFTERKTIMREVEKGSIWVFEQPQSLGFSNVTTNCRMTVVKLKSGGLWVHAPIAPTKECLRMLKELGAPVEYIVLPTFAYEHKIFVGPFSRRFPKAKVWVAPSQWSWPINMPAQLFGIFPKGVLKDDETATPWGDEIEHKVFKSSVGIGPYIEVAFFHKRTRTLLVTDAVVSVPEAPPELVKPEDLVSAAASNFFVRVLAGDLADEPVRGVPLKPTELTPAVRDLGWQRMALQILYIVPGDLRDPLRGFRAIANRLIVSPIVATLVFSTSPADSRRWVESICRDWNFRQIIPAHFSAPIPATPADLRAAFSFVFYDQQQQGRRLGTQEHLGNGSVAGGGGLLSGWFARLGLGGSGGAAAKQGVVYPEEDIRALNSAKEFLNSAGVVNK